MVNLTESGLHLCVSLVVNDLGLKIAVEAGRITHLQRQKWYKQCSPVSMRLGESEGLSAEELERTETGFFEQSWRTACLEVWASDGDPRGTVD